MTTAPKTVAIYARVSTDKQKVDMQLRAYVARSGWTVSIHAEPKQYILPLVFGIAALLSGIEGQKIRASEGWHIAAPIFTR